LKKVVIHGALNVGIEDSDVPSLAEDEVMIRVHSVSVCGSDIHLFRGTYNGPKAYPIMFGHEWSGEVVQCGDKVVKFKKGDRVTGDCSKYCDDCVYCESDRNVCEHIQKYGITVDGASAELIVRRDKYLYRLPETLDYSLGSLVEPLAVSANLIARIMKIRSDIGGKKILICGAAGIGLGAMLQLKYLHGCDDITMLEISDFRRGMAEKLGVKTIKSLTDGASGENYGSLYSKDNYDIVIETTGNAKIIPLIFSKVKPLGVIGMLGMLSEASFPQKMLVLKALTIVGSIGGTGYFDEVIDFIDTHREQVGSLISHHFGLFEIASLKEGFETASHGNESMKVQFDA